MVHIDQNTLDTANPNVPSSDFQPNNSSPRLLDQVRNVIRLKHYSIRTEKSYVEWIKR